MCVIRCNTSHIPLCFFFFNDTATTEIYTLSLHDALPISRPPICGCSGTSDSLISQPGRSEEHTSELQSPVHLVCRLLLEKKKQDGQKGLPQAQHDNDTKSDPDGLAE